MCSGLNSYKTKCLNTFDFYKTISRLERPLTCFPDIKCTICIFQTCSHGLTTVIKYVLPNLHMVFNCPKEQCETITLILISKANQTSSHSQSDWRIQRLSKGIKSVERNKDTMRVTTQDQYERTGLITTLCYQRYAD